MASASASSIPCTFRTPASRKTRRESQPPIRIAPTRKAIALAMMAKASMASRVPPVFAAPMMPEITERITRPSTSSITAAPRMIFDSRAESLPRSASTRAVMPTLVAARVAPMKTCASVSSPGSSQAETPQPRKNGAITPSTATSRLDHPTESISATFDSSPTWNSSRITPSWARISIPGDVRRNSRPPNPNSARLPSSMPNSSSPSTAGCPTRSKISPPTLAAARITTSPSSTGTTGPPCPAPSGVSAALATGAERQEESQDQENENGSAHG